MYTNPFRQYTEKDIEQDFERLRFFYVDRSSSFLSSGSKRLKPLGVKPLKNNFGYSCSNAFFQYQRFMTPTHGHEDTITFWGKNKKKIVEMAKKYKSDVYKQLQFMNHTPSQFPPIVAVWFYLRFNATTILDPFAGWGDRCIAAMSQNIKYIGFDSNKKLSEPYGSMIKFFKPYISDEKTPKIIFKPSTAEYISKNISFFDFVFSSPPFWFHDREDVLVEKYPGMTQINFTEFMDKTLIPIIQLAIKRGVWSCYYMPRYMALYIKKSVGLKWSKKISYSGMGNKKRQNYEVFCYK